MLKWLILIILFFSGFWVFYKDDMPDFISDSKFADITNTILFPLEVNLDKNFPKVRKNISKPQIYKLNYNQVLDFRSESEGYSRQVVYFFYNPANTYDRLLLTSLNRLIKSHPSKKYDVDYLFVAVTKTPADLTEFLKQTKNINFIPYYINLDDYSPVLIMFNRLGLSPTKELPRTIFKNISNNSYIEVLSGIFTKGRFEVLIEQKM